MQNKINNKWQWLKLIFLLLNILFPLRMAFAVGGITTDGTVGPAQSLSGPKVDIDQKLGTTVGKNLFHSFEQFNVNNGQTVTFTENTPNALDNVVSRVTGGSVSDINGTLRSTPGGHANLYLVNPSGIVFGKNAQINVPGVFHASTADEVRFQDGAKFSASQPTGSTLTAAAPASFGFLGTSTATNGLLKVDGAQLAVGQGKKLDMVGRNIIVENGAKLTAPEGEVRLEAVGQGSMTVPLNQPSETAHGALALTKSTIDASGAVGGKVIIRGSDLKMSQNAKIFANTKDKKNGTKINVHLTGDMSMDDGSRISASTGGSGNGGDIAVAVRGDMAVKGGSTIRSNTFGSGKGGNIAMVVRGNMAMKGGSTISASTFGRGAAGDIYVKANNLLLDGLTTSNRQTSYFPTEIVSDTNLVGKPGEKVGSAGNITLEIDNRLKLIQGGQISSTTFGTGNAGKITVKAGQFLIDGQGNLKNNSGKPLQTAIFNTAEKGSSGAGGNLAVTVRGDMTMDGGGIINAGTAGGGKGEGIAMSVQGNMSVKGGSTINAGTLGSGIGSNLAVTVRGDMTMDGGGIINAATFGSGKGGDIAMTVQGNMAVKGGSTIRASTFGSGKGGDIAMVVRGNMAMEGGSTISASTFGRGAAGDIYVKANNLLLDGLTTSDRQASYFPTGIVSDTNLVGKPGEKVGSAGNITLEIDNRLKLIQGGQISSTTFGTGNAGKITVKAGQFLIDGQGDLKNNSGEPLQTGIFNQAHKGSSGAGGNLAVTVRGDMTMDGRGIINAATFGSGKGGDIAMTVQGNMAVKGGSTISASTFGRGAAGDIYVKANNLLLDGLTTSNRQTSYFPTEIVSDTNLVGKPGEKVGSAGNITLEIANRLKLIQGGQISSTTFGKGNAGKITVKAGQLLIDGQGDLKNNSGEPLQTGIFNQAHKGSSGAGGNLAVTVRDDMTMKGGIISAATAGSGESDNLAVTVRGDMTMESGSLISARTIGSGKGGNLSVAVQGNMAVKDGGAISAATAGSGAAGKITVDAGQLLIDGKGALGDFVTGILTQAGKDSNGMRDDIAVDIFQGDIDVTVRGDMVMQGGGIIDASTFGNRNAGDIHVIAKNLMIDTQGAILTRAEKDSSGTGGNVVVDVQGTINMRGGGTIDAKSLSTGDAGNITVSANQLSLDQKSFISTEAKNSNGGNITINGGQFVQLINSGLITNVYGLRGNSGNITINVENLVMETGLIQANTGGLGASAGNIKLNIKGLIPSGQSLFKGRITETLWKPDEFGLNVIEAVAPNGISGLVQSTAPQLDLSGVLSNLGMPQFDVHAISQDYCSLGAGSSLIRQGKGGLPPHSRDSVLY
ncbi:two-partner secretion domain-containing protein [Methylobacter sp. YRD-M1]|uniref:two-partner secretion domain-containing protein n=1 Tax=Methylobacter sp. YRD-M1 TaxID=2911520 RepID=UPI00227D590F|nr:filamentous hemagglutinin N-terminal domain-containing protein [Methylobacter sp. YRD-M1]WAK00538.1 filamentous hemagglutinin N-terminal domain-containing protein [Methylobacter sp. YRD-M1]